MNFTEFEPKPDSLLSVEEWEVYSLLSEAWNKYVTLPSLFPEQPTFAFHINALKSIIMSRPIEKELLEQYKEARALTPGSDEMEQTEVAN